MSMAKSFLPVNMPLPWSVKTDKKKAPGSPEAPACAITNQANLQAVSSRANSSTPFWIRSTVFLLGLRLPWR